jgi:hypothetical protein
MEKRIILTLLLLYAAAALAETPFDRGINLTGWVPAVSPEI